MVADSFQSVIQYVDRKLYGQAIYPGLGKDLHEFATLICRTNDWTMGVSVWNWRKTSEKQNWTSDFFPAMNSN